MLSAVDYITLLPEGKQGPIPVPEGSWNKNTTYVRTDYKVPFVEHNKLYYLLMKPESMGVNPKEDYAQNGMNATWILIPSYEMVIVKAVIADGGLLGDFVFWGGKMFSKQGTDRQGNFSDRYTEYSKGNFIPNYIVDAVSGEVISLKGRFGIFDIVDESIVGREHVGGDETVRITTDTIPEATQFTPNWSLIDFNTLVETDKYPFARDEYDKQNVYHGPLRFRLPIKEIGEYKLSALSAHVSNVIFSNSGENAAQYIKYTANVECIVTQGRNIIRRTTQNIKDTYDGIDIEFYVDNKTTCDIELNFKISFSASRDGSFMATIDKTVRGVEHKKTPRQCTVIGKDGLYTSFSNLEFFHYKSGQGFTIRAGNYGFRITKEGIQKWSGGKWIAANI